MGAVCVTYCVGGLSLCNSIAGAYAEKSPVVVITGSPGLRERHQQSAAAPPGARFPHAVRGLREAVRRRHRADRPADRLSRDRSRAARGGPVQAAGLHRDSARHGGRGARDCRIAFSRPQLASDPEALAEAVDEAERWISSCKRPVDPGRRRDPSLRPAGRAAGAGRRLADPDRHHDARQERHPRNASAVRRPVRRGDGQRRGHAIRRRERLRDAARHVHDRHQPRHLHGQARSGASASTPRASSCGSAIITFTTCGWTISFASWPRAGRSRRRRALPQAAEPGQREVRAAARRADHASRG